jgi:hypothetical protein
MRREDGPQTHFVGTDIARPVGRAGRNDHDVSCPYAICLLIDAHLRGVGLVQEHLVDLVTVERDRVADPDLLDDDGDIRRLFRHECPDRVGTPAVWIGGICEWPKVEVSVKTHRYFPLRSINSIR